MADIYHLRRRKLPTVQNDIFDGTEHRPPPPRVIHTCHWPTCNREVPPRLWGCRQHWFTLPKVLRDRIWKTYVPGQENTKTPSAAYIEAAKAVQEWINDEIAAGRQH